MHLEGADQLRPQLGPGGVAVLGSGGRGQAGPRRRQEETGPAAGAATRWGKVEGMVQGDRVHGRRVGVVVEVNIVQTQSRVNESHQNE